ncbi:MAG: hypothetical protein SGPRY_012307, partial [Prymnesium sp.]
VSSTCRKTMRLIPTGKRRQQKVVVGDDTGSILCFTMKHSEVEQLYKLPPTGREVSRIEFGGVGDERDKIFWASGSTVHAMTKKGKEFLQFNTNSTETIRSLYAGDDDLHTAGEYIYSQFVSLADAGFYMATDKINEITCEALSGGIKPEVLLGCQDRMVRVLQPSGSDLLFEQAVSGPVLSLEKYDNPQGEGSEGRKLSQGGGFGPSSPVGRKGGMGEANDGSYREIVYGTENGQIGTLLLNSELARRGWLIDPVSEGRRGKAGGVQCICALTPAARPH